MNKALEKIVVRFVKEYSSKHGPKWKVCIPDGRGLQVRMRGFATRRMALDWATAQYEAVLQGKNQIAPVFTDQTFADYARKWVKERELKPATRIRYTDDIEKRLIPFFGHYRIAELTKAVARQFIEELKRDERIGNTTRGMIFAVFKRIVKDAETNDDIPLTRICELRGFKPNNPKPKFWCAEEMEKFIAAVKLRDDHELWIFALATGCRAGEIAALSWKNVHLFDVPKNHLWGFINIEESRCQKSGELHSTKNGDARQIPILAPAAEILRAIPHRKGFVFGGDQPIPANKQKHLSRDLRAIAVKAEVEPITFHQLRHSFCSYLDTKGVPRRIVSAIMGHRDLATTNRYSHIQDSSLLAYFANTNSLNVGVSNIPATVAEA